MEQCLGRRSQRCHGAALARYPAHASQAPRERAGLDPRGRDVAKTNKLSIAPPKPLRLYSVPIPRSLGGERALNKSGGGEVDDMQPNPMVAW